MDMTENDDKLIQSFFEDNMKEVADDGFSERVMRHLPRRAASLNRIWTIFCSVLGAVVFCLLDAWKGFPVVVGDVFGAIVTFFANIHITTSNVLMLVIGVLTITAVVTYNVVTSEKY
jgi:hypothetical protein